jgi:hypothetical protein
MASHPVARLHSREREVRRRIQYEPELPV